MMMKRLSLPPPDRTSLRWIFELAVWDLSTQEDQSKQN
jgi:hypothetical protein